ncbi:CHAT domain-containing protein [Limnoraphis robusta]|uniref:CHAT domain-containing protein n=1 Tax=Limnoraphis robusta TaxID=1118279 RepID=UPI00396AA621
MIEFYSHLRDVNIKAEALRQAQLAMIHGQVTIKDGQLKSSSRSPENITLPAELATAYSDLSHPYYWSGFTMIGSPW